jgi:hypothetical protein
MVMEKKFKMMTGRRGDGCLLVLVEGLCKERKKGRWLPAGTGGRIV